MFICQYIKIENYCITVLVKYQLPTLKILKFITDTHEEYIKTASLPNSFGATLFTAHLLHPK